jgi:hypothetical protein
MKRCNGFTIPEFTKEQITECKKCKHISGKKIWCCKFGLHIDSPRIVTQDKRIIKPPNFENDYKNAISGHKGSNFELISLAEYIQRRQKGFICPDKKKCPMRGCSRWRILVEKIRKCPKNEW